MRLSRREAFRLLGRLVGAAAAVHAVGCGDDERRGDKIFTADELTALEAFADVIIPPDDQPGGAALGAVAYIELLITAFDQDLPAIFAGGPLSDRNPFPDGSLPANDFATFMELDRIADAAWRLRVLGSQALPGGAPNEALLGPVVPLADQLKQGLGAAMAAATKSIAHMTADERATLFDGQPDEFRELMIDLVTEAAFAAPEYGGNPGGAGWAMVHFEGDSLPRGYSQWDGTRHVERPEAPLSTANPSDPEPLGDDVRQLIATVVQVLGGRVRT